MDKEQLAIKRLQEAAEMSQSYYEKPLVIAYSGGKDSEVLLELARRSKITFELHHSHTTADAPQTVRHIRKVFSDLEKEGIKCTIEYPKMSMWELIPYKAIPPTRIIRYCCQILKEGSCKKRMVATGVRWGESYKRSKRGIFEDVNSNREKKIILMSDNDEKRKLFERCQLQAKTICNPIIDFSNDEILDFYQNQCRYSNPLYDLGFKRIGCIGCPMAGKKRLVEFEIFPQYKKMYINAFTRMLEVRKAKGLENKVCWEDGNSVFEWWIN